MKRSLYRESASGARRIRGLKLALLSSRKRDLTLSMTVWCLWSLGYGRWPERLSEMRGGAEMWRGRSTITRAVKRSRGEIQLQAQQKTWSL